MKTLRILILTMAFGLAMPATAQDNETDNTAEVAPVDAVPAVVVPTLPPVDAVPAVVVPTLPPVEADVPPPAPAPEEPKDVGEAVQVVGEVITAFQSGHYLLGISLSIMLLTFAVRMFWNNLPRAAAPWMAIGLATVATMASAWATGAPWWQGLISGVAAGLGAIGMYEVGGKKLGRKLAPSPAAPSEA